MQKFSIIILIWCTCFQFSFAQDSNFKLPMDSIEHVLKNQSFELRAMHGARFPEDVAKKGILVSEDKTFFMVKAKGAVPGGEEFNNSPRFEVAAYELQKLFLDPHEYVVPPTVCRSFPLELFRLKVNKDTKETFRKTKSVLFVVQYWMENVTQQDVFDEGRLKTDSLYARHMANLNIFTYLILHNDANKGNVLISTDETNPRAFAVDNGVAFGADESARGTEWREIRTQRLPKKTVDRLREITKEDLENQLSVLAQFEIRDKQLVEVPLTEVLDIKYGVRKKKDKVQLGLTDWEIEDLHKRLTFFLKQVDKGEFELY